MTAEQAAKEIASGIHDNCCVCMFPTMLSLAGWLYSILPATLVDNINALHYWRKKLKIMSKKLGI